MAEERLAQRLLIPTAAEFLAQRALDPASDEPRQRDVERKVEPDVEIDVLLLVTALRTVVAIDHPARLRDDGLKVGTHRLVRSLNPARQPVQVV